MEKVDLGYLLEMSGNDVGSIAEDGTINDITGYIDTGSFMLNVLMSTSMYKGIPSNKIFTVAGAEATGKTFFCLGIVREFLNANKDGMVLYFDSESALTSDMLRDRGIDTKRLALLPVATVQDFATQLSKVLSGYIKSKSKRPLIIVLDSLGNLSTTKEMTDTEEGSGIKDMTRAQLIKGAFRVLNIKLGRAGVALLVTNHTYDKVGSFYPTKEMGGGSGAKYNSNIVIFLSKKKEKDGTEVVGNIIKCKLQKSRIAKENSMVELMLDYKTGLSKYYGLLEYAVKYGIFKKVSTRYEMPDGTKLFGKAIYKNPEKYFTKEVLDEIEKHIGNEFCYGEGESSAHEFESVDVAVEE